MNQQNLKAYLNIIEGLLSCPRGEEWILLRQNEGLVNGELVEVMEQVANYLAIEGNIKAAKYLHNWASKLHHIVTENIALTSETNDQNQAYIELINALLNCPKGSEESILEAHKDLIGPKLIKAMEQVANQIAAEGDKSTASFLTNLATDLNQTWLKNHQFEPTFKKEIASDPWFDEKTSVPDTSETETKLTHSERPQIKSDEESVVSSPHASISNDQQLIQQLTRIANSLADLAATLATRMQPSNPLWYMDVLEKAEAANWILTTEEVESLIGIKPHCNHDETIYHRGSWLFIKAGKIGAQTGWRVSKQVNFHSQQDLQYDDENPKQQLNFQ